MQSARIAGANSASLAGMANLGEKAMWPSLTIIMATLAAITMVTTISERGGCATHATDAPSGILSP